MGFFNYITNTAKSVWVSLKSPFSSTACPSTTISALSGPRASSLLLIDLLKHCEESLTVITAPTFVVGRHLRQLSRLTRTTTIPYIKQLHQRMEFLPPSPGIAEALGAKVFALALVLFQLRRNIQTKDFCTNALNSLVLMFEQELVLVNKDYTLSNIRTLLLEGSWDSEQPEFFQRFLYAGVADEWQGLVQELTFVMRECGEERWKTLGEKAWEWLFELPEEMEEWGEDLVVWGRDDEGRDVVLSPPEDLEE